MSKLENTNKIEIISSISAAKAIIKDLMKQDITIGFVPTMGALHIGHESLIKRAGKECDFVIVSIFVNPVQFGPNEDFSCYPRQLDKDIELCEKNHVDLIFAPNATEMYSDNLQTIVSPPDFFKDKLCGKTRIGHFDGVSTVVLKLFNILQPNKAYFGQKDGQQLIIIKKMCHDLNVSVEIIGCPIIRDSDGLACSSRNSYLSSDSRVKALSLYKTLSKIKELYTNGMKSKQELLNNALDCLASGVLLEYLDVYNVDTFEPVEVLSDNSLVAIAAKVDGIRLIDNIIL